MSTGLYVYWGALGDHNLNVPGHPLYQSYFLDVLAKAYQLKKIYFCSLFKDKVERTVEDTMFFIKRQQRSEIVSRLDVEVVSFGKALELVTSCDSVFLKARFRNKSRLQERSFDALKFETLLTRSEPEKTYIIDSDGELPLDFFEKHRNVNLLTYFLNHQFYDSYTAAPKSIRTLPPTLTTAFETQLRPLADYNYDLFFIGNEGLKQPALMSWLQKLQEDGLKVGVQGKWSPRYAFDIYQRVDRQRAYRSFEKSLATLQLSKEKYSRYNFLSPRLYEAGIVGCVPFIEAGYSFASDFCRVESYVEFREKLRCLRDGYDRDFRTIREEQYQQLQTIEEQLFRPTAKITPVRAV